MAHKSVRFVFPAFTLYSYFALSHLSLDLQTGAFLQLILVLTAIVSRMHILLEELGLCIDQAIDTLSRLARALDVSRRTFLW